MSKAVPASQKSVSVIYAGAGLPCGKQSTRSDPAYIIFNLIEAAYLEQMLLKLENIYFGYEDLFDVFLQAASHRDSIGSRPAIRRIFQWQ